MKNLSLKLFAIMFISFLGYSLQAQDQTFFVGHATAEVYSVDIAENGGTGTTGSSYAWTVTDSGTPPVDVTASLNTSPQGSNTFTINDWGSLPAGMYTLHVVETNATCVGLDMTIQVEIVDPSAGIAFNAQETEICSDGNAEYILSGAPEGAVISYDVIGGTVPNGTATVTGGIASIIITHDGAAVPVATQLQVTVTGVTLTDGTVVDISTLDMVETTNVIIVTTSTINFTP